jgi:Lipid A 3-O-deacylase (PagL)
VLHEIAIVCPPGTTSGKVHPMNSQLKMWIILPAILLLALVSTANAQTDWHDNFKQGSISFNLYGETFGDLTNKNVQTASQTGGIGYYIFDDVSLNLELTTCFIHESGPLTYGYGANFVLRQHLIRHKNWSLIADVGPGFLEAGQRVPPAGTSFNITFRTGLGITQRMTDHLSLIGGGRYYHLSNAEMAGRDRNPSLNGIEAYFGLLWNF